VLEPEHNEGPHMYGPAWRLTTHTCETQRVHLTSGVLQLRGLLVRQFPRSRASLCRLKAAQAGHQATPEVIESVSGPAAVFFVRKPSPRHPGQATPGR